MLIKLIPFKISSIFDISTGSLLSSNDLIPGNINRISVKTSNNGIIGKYDTINNKKARHFDHFISVNFLGNAYYHENTSSVEMKVHVLTIPDIEINKNIGLYITTALNKLLSGRYDYGNQLSSSKLKKLSSGLILPSSDGKNPDWEYMNKYIDKIKSDKNIKLNSYLNKFDQIDIKNNINFKKFCIKDLFKIKKTNSFNKSDLTKITNEKYDYITRTSLNRGILCKTGFIDNESINNDHTFSLGLLQMDFFYRDEKWYAGQFVRLIEPLFDIDKEIGIYIETVLSKLNPLLLSVLVRDVDKTFLGSYILLPSRNNIDPDWEYMRQYIKSLEYKRTREIKNISNII